MKLTLTSIKKKVLELDSVESVNISTKTGYITVLPNHEAIISAVEPGILTIRHEGKTLTYAVGGGILETDGANLSIIADMVEDGESLNLEEIKAKKEEARRLMEEYRDSGKMMNMDRYIELETDFLKESAKEQLAIR